MNLEEIRACCLKFPGATEDVKWGNDLVFSVADKMFAATGMDNAPVSLSFKAGEELFEELAEKPGFKPAPYLARAKWIAIEDTSRIENKQLEQYLKNSYDLIKGRLPKKVQENLK